MSPRMRGFEVVSFVHIGSLPELTGLRTGDAGSEKDATAGWSCINEICVLEIEIWCEV